MASRRVEGFEYNSYPQELVQVILTNYLAGATLEKLSIELEGVSFAGAQRVIDQAVLRGVLLTNDKHSRGGGLARKRARAVWERHPAAKRLEIARLAGCAETTVYRAIKDK